MNTVPSVLRTQLVPIIGATLCALLVLAPSPTYALPPRPTLMPTATPAPMPIPQPAPAGALIELHVHFDTAWPSASIPWQELWTTVQWQDGRGVWHDVEGWRGGLDEIVRGQDGEASGRKVWWVAEANLGQGPFRWQITRGAGGTLLGSSAAFALPSVDGAVVTVEIAL